MSDNDKIVTVTVLSSCEAGHTSRGVQVGPGDDFECWESQVEWLREQGVIGTARPRKSERKTFEEPPTEEVEVAAPDTPTEG